MDIFNIFRNNRNEENAIKMSKYLKNQFEFLGIKTPLRRKLEKEYFKSIKNEKFINKDFIKKCYDEKYREFQYLAIDYLKEKINFLDKNNIPLIKKLITTKSWWDTTDSLDEIIGTIALKDKSTNDILLKWSKDKNIWLRRVSIDHQLLRKEKTDTELLEKIIVNNFGSNEFFINKAIGWALRDYSKTNKEWVSNFIKKYNNNLSSLSIREGSKYL
ncbi:DNA alkylation repair protein [Anaerofustis sp.]|uniref:DNA alkylation repair protein n=1 Tax=Anaerofustis sp. TaxID=1872517 RepID=UPI0025C213AD|nr:DNA alkylation repair protein [Anaerofustis sp.]